jgi:hypothetical protein
MINDVEEVLTGSIYDDPASQGEIETTAEL